MKLSINSGLRIIEVELYKL